MRNINIEKLRKNNKKAKCCQILCFVYSFHYQQENILLPIPFSSRLWCCLTLFKFIKPKMRKCNFIRFLQKKSVLIKFSTKLTLHNIQQWTLLCEKNMFGRLFTIWVQKLVKKHQLQSNAVIMKRDQSKWCALTISQSANFAHFCPLLPTFARWAGKIAQMGGIRYHCTQWGKVYSKLQQALCLSENNCY